MKVSGPRLPSSAAALPAFLILVVGAVWGWGACKDDAWISYRYARNLGLGHGMTFNPGEPPVEGYTNFLWTVAMVPVAAWTDADPLVFGALLGLSCTLLAAAAVVSGVRALGGGPGAAALGGVVYACWPDVLHWSVAGLEQGMIQAFSAWGLLLTLRAWQGRRRDLVVLAGLALAGAALTRPEGHAIAGLAALALLAGGWIGGAATLGGVLLAVLVPYHAWRLATFGALLPNTYLVKGGGGLRYWELGVDFVRQLLVDGQVAVILAAAILALLLAPRGQRGAVGAGLLLPLLFLVYMVKVGRDEFPRYRLFLPAWPVLVALAAYAASLPRRTWARGLAGGVLLVWAATNLHTGLERLEDLRGDIERARFNHASLGKFLSRHSEAGESVAIQDIGAPAFYAPRITFIDTIGLADRNITALYQRYGYQPFLRSAWRQDPENRRRLDDLYREGREYLESRRPDWVAYVAVVDAETGDQLAAQFAVAPDLNPVDPYLEDRPYYYGWAGEDSFREEYVYVRSWRRSDTFWVTLWRRRDLLQAPPPEVVLPRAPPAVETVALANGHRLIGRSVTSEVYTRDEAWVETLIKVAGPEPAGTVVDVEFWRIGRDGQRHKRRMWVDTHVPGDWMWPAPNWSPGQVVRDRVLIQLPEKFTPGRYAVTWRLRHRPTDTPLSVPSAEDGRIDLGELVVRERRPWELAFIRPTDPTTRQAP